jgi:thiol-disulfide isomerase/thioredoxin
MKRMMVLAWFGLALAAHAEYSVGQTPPDFTCTDWNGGSFHLYAQRGKVVLINFGATWCGPCNEEMPYLQNDFYEVYDPAAFAIVHVDTDGISAQALHNHWDALGITFPVLVGCNNLYNSYGDGYIPYNCLLDTEGHVLFAESGFSQAGLNTMHDLIEANMSVDFPVFSISQLTVVADDNSDGRPDGGESVALGLALRNSPIAVPATGVTVTMTCTDPAVSITGATVTYPAANPGEVVTGAGNFTFTVAEGIQPHWANFNFHYSAPYSGGTATGDMPHVQRMGRPDLLVVDSDGPGYENEPFVTSALETAEVQYDLWDGQASPISAEELTRYSRIYWLGGVNQNDMTDSQENGLRAFLDNGGKLLLSSQYMSDNPDRADFLADIFGVTVTEPDGGTIFVIDNVAGDLWFGGTAFVISGNQAANNNEEPDVLSVAAPGTVFGNWRQNPHAGQPAAVYTTGEHTAIFCGFPIEASRVHGSVAGSMTVASFLDHVQTMFDSELDVDQPPVAQARDFSLGAAHPNPFNPATTMEIAMARPGTVTVTFYNALGQEARRVELGRMAAGSHAVTLDAGDLASGLYLAQLAVDDQPRDAQKLMLLK